MKRNHHGKHGTHGKKIKRINKRTPKPQRFRSSCVFASPPILAVKLGK
jgi:hypothetical protein